MSPRLQQRAATSVDDTEEDLENVQAQRLRNRGQKRKRNDSCGSEAEQTLSKPKREEVHVERVIR